MPARVKRKRSQEVVVTAKTKDTLACLHGAVNGGAEKRLPNIIDNHDACVFLGSSSLSRVGMPASSIRRFHYSSADPCSTSPSAVLLGDVFFSILFCSML
jgi:hypothetical protein